MTRLVRAGVTASLMLTSTAAFAASEEEWLAFRADVAAKCLAAAEPHFASAEAVVDPFGSESYGLALLRGQARGAEDVEIMAICVYDKLTETVEVGGELPSAAPPPPVPSPAILGNAIEPCEADCRVALAPLAPADDAAFRALPAQVAETLAATAELPARDPSAEAVADELLTTPIGDISELAAGERTCTVYWFGFLEEASREVGTHRCAVSAGPDGLVIEKLTGERMAADLRPLDTGAAAVIGRTFLPDHALRRYDPGLPDNPENPNFGNYVGLAFMAGETLVIVDADTHGFTEPDPTFFAVLVVEPPG